MKASMSKINEELHRDETSPPLYLGVKISTPLERTGKPLVGMRTKKPGSVLGDEILSSYGEDLYLGVTFSVTRSTRWKITNFSTRISGTKTLTKWRL